MTYFRLDNMHQTRHISEAINRAMKLPEDHHFGDTFLTDYVFERTDLLTTFRRMTHWCRECKFYYRSETNVRHEFRMSRPVINCSCLFLMCCPFAWVRCCVTMVVIFLCHRDSTKTSIDVSWRDRFEI